MKALSVLLTVVLILAASPSRAGSSQKSRRNPVAIVVAGGDIYVANRCGSLTVLSGKSRKVVSEVAVGKRLSGLAVVPESPFLVAADEGRHALVLLKRQAGGIKVVSRWSVPHSPVSVSVSRDGARLTVASLWARQLTVLNWNPQATTPESPRQTIIDLPFAPRMQWLAPDDYRLVVADAFGGRLGVVDLKQKQLVSVRRIPGHNIRGLRTSGHGSRLLISHQTINGLVPTQKERVFWGSVVGNVVREVELKELFAQVPPEDIDQGAADIAHWRLHPLGRPGSATGDPGDVIVTENDKTLVLLSGINQLAISAGRSQPFTRLKVGIRPIAMALDPGRQLVYVANMLDDSISVLDLRQAQIVGRISLGDSGPASVVERGERLFYDASLSLDGWYSCHSCHTDGHTNGLLNDNLGDGSFGAPKRILSLLGVRDTGPWAWTGDRRNLNRQVHKSILETMRGPATRASKGNVKQLTAYIRSLEPPPSIAMARGRIDQARIARGRAVFARRNCGDCHKPGTYTSKGTYAVGLKDELGKKEFNPPSLRGVSQRDSYFHDGRAFGLEAVFQNYRHPHGEKIPARELADLLVFLRSL